MFARQTLRHIPLLLTSDRIYLKTLQAIKEVFNGPETVKHSFSVTLNFLVMQISTLLTQFNQLLLLKPLNSTSLSLCLKLSNNKLLS